MKTRTIALDFDGVIHRYSLGWHDGTCYDIPVDGCAEAIQAFQALGFAVCVFSTRDPRHIVQWFKRNLPGTLVAAAAGTAEFWESIPIVGVFSRKPVAEIYVDDRAVRFETALGWDGNIFKVVTLLRDEDVGTYERLRHVERETCD